MLKKHGCNAKFGGVKLGKDILRIVGTIIVADASMVTPYDEVRTTIVLPHQGVENGLAWSSITHCSGENPEDYAISRIIVLQQNLIAEHTYISRYIIALGITHQR